jgi:tRNA G46 methylase TrmB
MITKKIYNNKKNTKKNTKKNYISKLKKIYPTQKYDSVPLDNLYHGYKITYGEMEYDGIHKLYNYIKKQYNQHINCFIDIGSGRGKLCMYMASQPKIKKVLGIEIVKERHYDAEHIKSQLNYEYSKKVTLLNKDITDIDFEQYKNNQILIWFSNLCFEVSTIDNIFNKLQHELPKGTIICCSKKPMTFDADYLNSINIPMSWSNLSNVYIYRLK